MLHAKEIIRYEGALWRVAYVNPSRAYIVPVVLLSDGTESEAERRGVSISAGSIVPVVTDISRTRLEMELEEAEREVAAAKREAALVAELAEAEREVATARAEAATMPSGGRSAYGWAVGPTPFTTAINPIKTAVYGYVAAHPGCRTKDVVVAGASAGAVAACLDRFSKIGVVKRVDLKS